MSKMVITPMISKGISDQRHERCFDDLMKECKLGSVQFNH